MSALHIKCPRCGGTYLAGVVGTWLWPGHVCSRNSQSRDRCWCGRLVREHINGQRCTRWFR